MYFYIYIKFLFRIQSLDKFSLQKVLVSQQQILKLNTDKVVWDSYYEMKEKLSETQANLDETRWKLILMETKLEDLECNNNNNNIPDIKKWLSVFEGLAQETKQKILLPYKPTMFASGTVTVSINP